MTNTGERPPLFKSFLQAGFECSTHKLKSNRRVDVVAGSQHDRFARQDYQRLRDIGIRTAREGLRWHLIEKSPGKYDFASAFPILEAAEAAGVEVIWDLLHFGWPDHWQIFDPSFIAAFREFSLEAARMLSRRRSRPIFIAPVNEISFLSWAGGDEGFIFPFGRYRARELKRQLVLAAITASKAIRAEFPHVRLMAPEPAIHVVAQPDRPRDVARANRYRLAMFEAWDMLAGRMDPELGGEESCLDIVGVNYYDRNQWFHRGRTIMPGDKHYRPFAEILNEVYARYRRPMLVSETGAENEKRAPWYRYVRGEVEAAMAGGVELHGLCIYPIVNHPGWEDNRHCYNGLWDYASDDGAREIYEPLARELRRQSLSETSMQTDSSSKPDLICFSHLRWNFVFQRPQHLMSRFARERRVFYVEEPIFERGLENAYWEERTCAQSGVRIVVPHLPEALLQDATPHLKQLVAELLESSGIHKPLLWCYTAMALDMVPTGMEPSFVIYDCMDELSAFRNAPAAMRENEHRMFQLANLVFTGGFSLFEAKRDRHPAIFPFPSGVDVTHFSRARQITGEVDAQRDIPRPRIGFAGVIDERMDLQLLAQMAQLRPDWHFVMVGPVVKIDPATLPAAPSIHWLGIQDYMNLPAFFSGWDVAIMPFAINESTRFISPTKTPEYLAAGLPVVSTPIADVVRPYGTMELARIAATPWEFVSAIEEALREGKSSERQKRADEFIKACSWDDTWQRMNALIDKYSSSEQPQPLSEDLHETALDPV